MSTSATRFLQQENIRLTKEVEALKQQNLTLNRYLETVKEIHAANQQLSSIEDPFDRLKQLFNKVTTVIGAMDGSIMQLDDEAGELVFVIVHGELSEQLVGFRMKSDEGIAGWVVENREPIIVNHPRQDWRFSVQVDEAFHFTTRSIASVPVMSEQGKFLGVIHSLNKRGEFTQADIALLLVLSQVAAKVLESS